MGTGWKTTGTLHKRDKDTSVIAWIKKIKSPSGENTNYKEVNIRPLYPYNKKKNSKPVGYHVEDFLLGQRKQSFGFDVVCSTESKAKAIKCAKKFMRKN